MASLETASLVAVAAVVGTDDVVTAVGVKTGTGIPEAASADADEDAMHEVAVVAIVEVAVGEAAVGVAASLNVRVAGRVSPRAATRVSSESTLVPFTPTTSAPTSWPCWSTGERSCEASPPSIKAKTRAGPGCEMRRPSCALKNTQMFKKILRE